MGVVERAIASRPLPVTLHLERALTRAATPLVGALAARRLKHGKEDPERVAEILRLAAALLPRCRPCAIAPTPPVGCCFTGYR